MWRTSLAAQAWRLPGRWHRAAPDGYTLVLAGMGPNITGPALNPAVGYHAIRDFTHIAMIAGDSTLFAVHPSLGVRTLPDLVSLAKRGTAISCGSPGVGTIGHLTLEQFRRKAGL
jgi:tripartite-type tricarboxylate transporter receptor subunit TctC